jgi:hypothetical protein
MAAHLLTPVDSRRDPTPESLASRRIGDRRQERGHLCGFHALQICSGKSGAGSNVDKTASLLVILQRRSKLVRKDPRRVGTGLSEPRLASMPQAAHDFAFLEQESLIRAGDANPSEQFPVDAARTRPF